MKVKARKKHGPVHRLKSFLRQRLSIVVPETEHLPEKWGQSDEHKRRDDITALAARHGRFTESGQRYHLGYQLRLLERQFQGVYRRLAARVEAREKGTRNEEWLLDNRHIIQEAVQLVRESLPNKFLRQLPKVPAADGKIDIRARALAALLVANITQPLDIESIRQLVDHYQEQTVLTTGELWALPALLQMSLLQQLARFATEALESGEEQSESCGLGIACTIISLRQLRSHNWRNFVESLSRVERILQTDPAGAYGSMDFETRDTYRNAVEKIARNSGQTEHEVARHAIDLSKRASSDRRRHVGYYLIGDGRPELEEALGYRPGYALCLYRFVLCKATTVYFSALAVFSVPPLLALGVWLLAHNYPLLAVPAVLAIAAVPLVGLALSLVNGLITHSLPPRKLPKLDFDDTGIPDNCRTAVVMPVLFADAEDMRKVLECLEINFLNNDDRNLVYVVLSDFGDADRETAAGDESLLQAAREAVNQLNQRYGNREGRAPFLLLHRKRLWNPAENCWMGWERKRGKLIEFNRLLCGKEDTSFTTCIGDKSQLGGIRYVITLDADSQMPPGTAGVWWEPWLIL